MHSGLWSPFVLVEWCNCDENETKQSCFNDLLRLLNIFIAKLILVKITLTCLQYDYDTRGNTGKQTF